VYGPHTACLYVRSKSLEVSLKPLTHHFLPVDGKAYQLQPGGPGYELVYATTAVLPYFLSLSSNPSPSTNSNVKAALDDAFARIEAHEHDLIEPLLAYLRSKKERGVLIVGDEQNSPSRVPTISFVVKGDRPISSKQLVSYFDKLGGVSVSLVKPPNTLISN
jgi:selenocysteine lyase/cysteine desulfurase